MSLAAHLVPQLGAVIDVELVDLSSRGCKVRSPHVWVGDHMSLSVPGKGTLGCTVRWSLGGFAGLEFDPEPVETEQNDESQRASERIAVDAEVKLRRVGRPNFNVTLRDLSLDGCKVDMVERPSIGEAVQLVFRGLATIEARVQWIDGFVAGLQFEKPFHPAVFDLLIERLRAAS